MTTTPTPPTGDTFHTDLVAALAALTEVPKAGKVNAGQRRYTYMTLPDLLTHVRATLAPYHLAVTQILSTSDTGFCSVETVLLHASGRAHMSGAVLFDQNTNPQVAGSAITYWKRYQLAALVGLAGDDDDDGARAVKAPQELFDDMTRPVTREQVRADTWTTPEPITPGERPDHGSPSTTNLASDKSKKMMWALLRGTGMDTDQTRLWMGTVLNRDGEWHTDDLTQFEVSSIIDRLKSEST